MSPEKGIIETFTELASRYETVMDSELGRFWGWRYSDFVDHLIGMTPLEPEDVILDVATGTGLIPRKINNLELGYPPVHGLDVTQAMLERARQINLEGGLLNQPCLVCAAAESMPYDSGSFDVVLCGLASHHMDVRLMVSEIYRVLRPEGELSISDVGGYPIWNLPGVKVLLKIAGFGYFIIKENLKRAWTEAQGISNIRSVDEWHDILTEFGFRDITITRMRSRFFWIPQPLLIRASKNTTGE
jgi:ubiquinone/menaquinone biosynthesis C-methylase UbiE